MTTTKTYDYLNRLTAIESRTGVAPVSIFNYQYNQANQRTLVTNVDNTHWLYQYDLLGQVISGKKYWSDGTPVAGQQFEYGFDDIGNRKTTKSGGDAVGSSLRLANYSANSLNQYTSRDVPGYATVLGSANPNATVTVNLQRAVRQGSYFWDELSVDNSSSALWLSLTNLAVLNNGTNPDIIATNIGNALIAQTPQTFTYDADGNLTSDGLWTNTWNAENRLIATESSASVPPAARKREEWSYLPDGRWNQRIVSIWNTNTLSYQPSTTNRFVWDGQVLLAILDSQSLGAPEQGGGGSILVSLMRGLDLSGSLQGAGGVGGLLAVNFPANGAHFAAFDGNGNVSALVNAADGTVSANYEYDPFGQTLRLTGPVAKLNPIRFSTQFADEVTGDLKYLYRDYNPNSGRWLSRDLIEEQGGANIYGFVANDPLNEIDSYGLKIKGCIDKYLNSLGLKNGEDYSKSEDSVYTALQDVECVDEENFPLVVVVRMMMTSTTFNLAGNGEKEQESNLKDHIAARKTIVDNALQANFDFAVGTHISGTGFYDDPQAYYDSINNKRIKIACQRLSDIIFETGNKFHNPGHRDYDGVWIPGDWGYIRNLDYEDHPEHWLNGAWSGENVFHTGKNGGDELFWGHFKPWRHPAMAETEWFHQIANDWVDINKKTGSGRPNRMMKKPCNLKISKFGR